MKLLTDSELQSRIYDCASPLIAGISTREWQTSESPIQPCSVDLRIGLIQVAPDQDQLPIEEISGSGGEYLLETGATAVLTTMETLALPSNIAGIGFPPSHVSIKGLLMTNPGHIDPGYTGRLHFTVINMGKTTISLSVGAAICTVLFFELDSAVDADLADRKGGARNIAQVPLEGLPAGAVRRLGRDFINLDERAKEIAHGAVRKAQISAAVLAGVLSAAISLGSQFVPYYLTRAEEIKKMTQSWRRRSLFSNGRSTL